MLKNMTSLRGVSILGKAAQKQLRGGDSIGGEMGGGSGTCAILLPPGSALSNYSADHEYNINGTTILVGISKATVTQMYGQTGVQWCCASCASASWIPS